MHFHRDDVCWRLPLVNHAMIKIIHSHSAHAPHNTTIQFNSIQCNSHFTTLHFAACRKKKYEKIKKRTGSEKIIRPW